MKRTEILVVGTNEVTLQHAINLINANNNWNGIAASNAEDAIEKFHQRNFDVVVFTNSIDEEERKLRKIFTLQNPDTVIIKSNNDDLPLDAIQDALQKQQQENRPTFSFTDDALKNAMLPITIQ